MRWPHLAPIRWTSYTVDTCLLTAALMLLTVLPGALFSNGWLTVKIGLLVVYIVLGVFAIKRGRTKAVKAACYVAALATFRSEEHTSELQSLMRISYAVFCLKKKKHTPHLQTI